MLHPVWMALSVSISSSNLMLSVVSLFWTVEQKKKKTEREYVDHPCTTDAEKKEERGKEVRAF